MDEKHWGKLYMKTGDPKSKSYLVEMIRMAVQKWNAESILSSLPAVEGLEPVFFLLFINFIDNFVLLNKNYFKKV